MSALFLLLLQHALELLDQPYNGRWHSGEGRERTFVHCTMAFRIEATRLERYPLIWKRTNQTAETKRSARRLQLLATRRAGAPHCTLVFIHAFIIEANQDSEDCQTWTLNFFHPCFEVILD